MNSSQIILLFKIVFISLLSGWADSRGFLYASEIWHGDKLVVYQLFKSALGFSAGIGLYWLVVKYLNQLGVGAPEIQSIIWFSVVIIGIALSSGRFFAWPLIDQLVGLIVVFGIGWLTVRTSG